MELGIVNFAKASLVFIVNYLFINYPKRVGIAHSYLAYRHLQFRGPQESVIADLLIIINAVITAVHKGEE